MAITGTVPASELDPKKGLRAQDYVIDPKRMATNLVRCWLESSVMGKVTNIRTKPMVHLIEEISQAIRIAYERGAKQQLEVSKAMGAALREPTAARKILPACNASGKEQP